MRGDIDLQPDDMLARRAVGRLGRALQRPIAAFKSTSPKVEGEAGSVGSSGADQTLLAEEIENDSVQLTGQGLIPATTTLNIQNTLDFEKWPVFRILGKAGNVLPGAEVPAELGKEEFVKMYSTMVQVQAMDDIFYNAQRQGRISFYMQNAGEEGIHIGSAAALTNDDVILAQYRELGVLLWRGFGLQQAADQCFGNVKDLGKGRQMPVHYGSKELNFQTISSPLATQLPQASGVAYALKLSKKEAVAVTYFGEGAASEGDFHAAINIASTLDAPCIFFCRNNGYAISTPVKDQFRGDGIISRAAGYGVHAVRVDGNDMVAVYKAMKEAKAIALAENRPVIIEAMSYRRGHHSTSDDSTRYRSLSEIEHWHKELDPLTRVRNYMQDQGWWNDEDEQNLRDSERLKALDALTTAENRDKAPFNELFQDVFRDMPPNLIKQRAELIEHMEKYPEHYKA